MKFLFFYFLISMQVFAYQIGDTLPNELLKTLEMDKKKVYIISFFASWCGTCKKEIPLISRTNRKIDKNKAKIIGIDIDKNIQDAIDFQNTLKSNKNLNFQVINDTNNKIVSEFSPIGMPTIYYVKNKKVIKILTGAIENIDIKILTDLKNMEL